MPDYRLSLVDARQRGLLPDLAPIRADMRNAVINLYGELFESNPRMPFADELPACADSELNEAQRALFALDRMIEVTPPWEPWMLPRMIWAARLAGIGKAREDLEHSIRMSGNDPDFLAAEYARDPDWAGPGPRGWKSRFWRDPYRLAPMHWWGSIDHPEHLEFNRCVVEFAIRRLPELIALDNALPQSGSSGARPTPVRPRAPAPAWPRPPRVSSVEPFGATLVAVSLPAMLVCAALMIFGSGGPVGPLIFAACSVGAMIVGWKLIKRAP